jgi:SRSO17 transposase
MAMAADAVRDLDEWLKPFLEVVGRKTRRSWAPLYVRGLLGPGERKSLQPMAVQLGLGGTTSCSASSPARPGMTARCGRCWPVRRTG